MSHNSVANSGLTYSTVLTKNWNSVTDWRVFLTVYWISLMKLYSDMFLLSIQSLNHKFNKIIILVLHLVHLHYISGACSGMLFVILEKKWFFFLFPCLQIPPSLPPGETHVIQCFNNRLKKDDLFKIYTFLLLPNNSKVVACLFKWNRKSN